MENIHRQDIDNRLREGFPLRGRWHNGFHLEMPFGLINDPNGLTYINGEYHIFYQWNPLGCQHKNKCWAHVKTKDLVNYTIPELSMWPTDSHDKDGCYSGCGFVEDNRLRVLYTCNTKDENGYRTPAQRMGTLMVDGEILKDEIVLPKEAEGYTPHFRDPYVFNRQGHRYFVVGAQTEGLKGRAVIYKEDAQAPGNSGWHLLGEIKTGYQDFGYMWECPNFLHIDGQDVLMFCPQGLAAQEYQYQNLYQSGYVVGNWNPDTMEMVHGEFQELDRGFDFYAPQVMVQEDRYLMWGWMGIPEEENLHPCTEDGWVFSLTVPRELSLKDGHIYQRPARELENLRMEGHISRIKAQDVAEYAMEMELPKRSDINLACQLGEARELRLSLCYGAESLQLIYDREKQVMAIDRSGMKLGGKGIRCFKLAAKDTLQLQILADTSAVEIFFQQGREAAALFVYPEAEVKPQLKLEADGKIKSLEGTCWELQGFSYK